MRDAADAPGAPFTAWSRSWMSLAEYRGRRVPDEEERIAQLVALWHEPILGSWERGVDARLLDAGRHYQRTHTGGSGMPRGEHAIEHEILCRSPADPTKTCLGGELIDGVNAVPLAKDAGGGRAGNVEADLALLVRRDLAYRILLVEVKATSNNAWYAAVENLRQLRLFTASRIARRLFHVRRNEGMPERLGTTAVVLAPLGFYTAAGAKREAVAPAAKLFTRMREETERDLVLATWDSRRRAIERYEPS